MTDAAGDPPFDPEAVIDAVAPLRGLTVYSAYRSAVAFNLEVSVRFARIVLTEILDDEAEPAPVFRA